MDRRFLFSAILLLLLGMLNCTATTSPHSARSLQAPTGTLPPEDNAGGSIEIFNDPLAAFSAAMGSDGIAHIVLCTPENHDIFHYEVDVSGIRNKKIIKRSKSSQYLDTVFDNEGCLHLIVNDTHYIYQNEEWLELQKSPCHLFVKGGRHLICVRVSRGWDAGAPGKWEWYGFIAAGGYGGGGAFLWPWFSYPDKLSVMQYDQGTWSEWCVIDKKSKFELLGFSTAADRKDQVHILYGKGRGGMFSMTSAIEYALLDLKNKKVRLLSSETKESATNWNMLPCIQSGQAFGFGGSGGFAIVVLPSVQGGRSGKVSYSLVTDPLSGASLVVGWGRVFKGHVAASAWIYYSFVDEAGRVGPVSSYPASSVLAGTAGRGHFDLLVLPGAEESSFISYIRYESSSDTWSDPVDLAEAKNSLFPARILSDTEGRVLAVYPANNKLVAKWIRRAE